MYDNLPDLEKGLVLFTALTLLVGGAVGIFGLLALNWLGNHVHIAI